MESKHKNALIGALLAVVFVMAVGYAAFAQLLTINGSATIDSKWDVHFDPNQDSTNGVAITNGGSDTTTSGTIAYTEGNTIATLTAGLKQPGDVVTFTLKPSNYGSLAAHAQAAPVITAGTGETAGTGAGELNIASGGQSATKGNIQWDIVSFSNKSSLTGANSTTVAEANQDTIVVRATFIGGNNEAVAANQSAKITITINYVQV